MVRIFGVSVAVTIAVLAASLWIGGPQALALVAILAVLEISLSFDNAVINATVLERLSTWWQNLFLTVGVLLAVFGMRLVFPLLIVAATAGLSPAAALDLALNQPEAYASALSAARPAIGAFGGMFLAMIFLDFIVEEHEHTWLAPIERPLAKLGGVESLSVALAMLILLATTRFVPAADVSTVMVAGTVGIVSYLLVNGLAAFFEDRAAPEEPKLSGIAAAAHRPTSGAVVGRAAFFLFVYLQVLDASFSFDGVIGAFAITTNIFIVAAGLGIGAFYIRSMTVYLVRRGTLAQFIYLEHGAHYAIGALAVVLLATIAHEVPEILTGLLGIGFIGAALLSSVLHRRRWATPPEAETAGADTRADPGTG
jgi:hypothetical protein